MPKILFILCLCAIMRVDAQFIKLTEIDTIDYFNFWEGTWEGTWPEGDQVGKAINKLTWIAGDKVLQENFEITDGQNKGFKGTSISVYRPNLDVWKQAWADNQGSYFDFTGVFDGDNRIFQTTPVTRNDQPFIQRMVFKNITKDSFTWDWESSNDGGTTWNLNWQINYTRIK